MPQLDRDNSSNHGLKNPSKGSLFVFLIGSSSASYNSLWIQSVVRSLALISFSQCKHKTSVCIIHDVRNHPDFVIFRGVASLRDNSSKSNTGGRRYVCKGCGGLTNFAKKAVIGRGRNIVFAP